MTQSHMCILPVRHITKELDEVMLEHDVIELPRDHLMGAIIRSAQVDGSTNFNGALDEIHSELQSLDEDHPSVGYTGKPASDNDQLHWAMMDMARQVSTVCRLTVNKGVEYHDSMPFMHLIEFTSDGDIVVELVDPNS